jgi:hypothetical protein
VSTIQPVLARLQLGVGLKVVPERTTSHRSTTPRPHTTGTAVRPAKTSPGSWDAFADVDVFVDEVLTELAVMARIGTRRQPSGAKPPLAGAALRKAVMAI